MKPLFFILSLVLFSSCATNTSFNDFYQNNQKESDFSLGLNASIVRTFLPEEDFEDIKPVLKKAKHVRVLVFSENTEQMGAKFNKFIKKSKFERVVKVKEDNDKIVFFILEKKDKIKEIVLEVSSDGDLVLLGLKTNLTQSDIDNFFIDNDISLN